MKRWLNRLWDFWWFRLLTVAIIMLGPPMVFIRLKFGADVSYWETFWTYIIWCGLVAVPWLAWEIKHPMRIASIEEKDYL